MPKAPELTLGTSAVLDRPHLALLNILEGNPDAAVRSFYDPDALSPGERETLASRLGLQDSWLEPLINIASNPVVLMGLAGTLLTPAPNVKDFLRKTSGEARGPLVKFIAPITEQPGIVGSPLTRLLPEAAVAGNVVQADLAEKYYTLLANYEKSTGKRMTEDVLNRVIVPHIERRWDPERQWWQVRAQQLRKEGDIDYAETLLEGAQYAHDAVEAQFAKLGKHGEEFAKGWTSLMQYIHKTHFDPEVAHHYYRGLHQVAAGDTPGRIAKEVEGYFPHLPELRPRELQADAEIAKRVFMASPGESRQYSQSALRRKGVSLPSAIDALEINNVTTTADGTPWSALVGLGPTYSTDTNQVIARYIRQLSNAHMMMKPDRIPFTYPLLDVKLPQISPLDLPWKNQPYAKVLGAYREDPLSAYAAGTTAPFTADVLAEMQTVLPEQALAKAGRLMNPLSKGIHRAPTADELAQVHELFRSATSYYRKQKNEPALQAAHSLYAKLFPGPNGGPSVLAAGITGNVGRGQMIREHIEALAQSGDAAKVESAALLNNKVLPLMLGHLTQEQLRSMNKWQARYDSFAGLISKMSEWPTLGFAKDTLKRASGWLKESAPGYMESGSAITRWLTYSTLGLNLPSSAINLTQPFVNQAGMGPLIGKTRLAPAVTEGTEYVMTRLPDYFRLRGGVHPDFPNRQLLSHEALAHLFPEFYGQHLELDPALSRISTTAFDELFEKFLRLGKSEALPKIGKVLMTPFHGSELFNRMESYYGARIALEDVLPGTEYEFASSAQKMILPRDKAHPVVQKALNESAAELMGTTQFGSGPLHQPVGTLGWWAPWKQYTVFPARQLNLLLRLSGNPAWLSRTALTTGLLYSGAKEILGTDYSRGIITGGLPQLSTDAPFAPLPVPPALQLIGAGAMAAGGNADELRQSLPLLVPGGIQLSRLASFMPGGVGVSKTLMRPYADYGNPTPEGRIPVYSGRGSLTGYYSPVQLMAKAAGMQDVADGSMQEAQLTKYLLRQRDVARQFKKDYMDSMYQNDTTSMQRLQEQWSARYPGLGPIPVGKSDVRSLHMRRDVTRLERVMETIPPTLRPTFAGAVAAGLGRRYPEILGLTGEGLTAGGSISMREAYRLIPAVQVQQKTSALMEQEPSMHGQKLQSRLLQQADDDAINVRRSSIYPSTNMDEEAP